MKINEVEALVGISKRNIRFYEKEGLLTPGRNSDNGYREYGQEDVNTLKQVKLLRKLDVPLEEIRRLQRGELTVEDVMGRHIIALERQQDSLEAMGAMCVQLLEERPALEELDADRYLAQMEAQERGGTRFVNIKRRDTRRKYIAPVAAALGMVVLMGGMLALILWGFSVDVEEAPPLPLVLFLAAIPIVIILGVIAALCQRIKQIRGGEEDAASQY